MKMVAGWWLAALLALVGCSGDYEPAPAADPEPGNGGTDATNSDCSSLAGQDAMLCRHNNVRATADPAPNPALKGLVWDADLATVAQNWAEQCTWEHNENADADYSAQGGSGPVGENLAYTSDTTSPPEFAVPLWASEASDYDYASNGCASGQVCGHYTQLVWRDTLKVGCGSMACSSINGLSSGGLIVVCDYSPAGNYIGERPY